MEYREQLDALRQLLEEGDSAAAMAGMLDTMAALMDEVDTLNVQLETLLDSLGSDEDEDECTYIVTCGGCGCVMEVEGELLEDEDAELSCPQCGEILEL